MLNFLHLIFKGDKTKYFLLILIVIFSSIVFSNLIYNELLISWTDQLYIIDNPEIKELSYENIKNIFTTFFVDNYHPFTNLSNAIEYHFFGLNPMVYHLNNLLIHLLNVCLVYILFLNFNKKPVYAFIASILFAIHPMHVESVAWASERKDMLYSFFFLSSILFYLQYISNGRINKISYYLSISMFLFSLLSKSAAVSLAPVILLLDFYINGKPDKKTLLEKIPFFMLSLFFGVLALFSQKGSGALDLAPHFPVFDRIFLTSYTIIFYIFKFFIPIKLSAFHPYPQKIDNVLPYEFYASFIALLFIIVIVFFSGKFKKNLITGLLLYFIPISLVLQIIPAGRTIVAERFSYISYIGLLFIVIKSLEYVKENYRIYIYSLICIYILFLSFISFNRVKIWKDSYILYSDVTEKYPYSYYAFWTKGNSKYLKGEYETAMKDYLHTLKLNPSDDDSYLKIGNIYFKQNKLLLAEENYLKAIKNNHKNDQAFNNLGLTYELMGKDSFALKALTKAIFINPEYISAFVNRGNLHHKSGNYKDAISDYDIANKLFPNNADILSRRGLSKLENNNLTSAITDFTQAINLNKKRINLYIMRGLAYHKYKDYNNAIIDFTLAIRYEPKLGYAYYLRANSKNELNRKNDACFDWKMALSLNYTEAKQNIELFCR